MAKSLEPRKSPFIRSTSHSRGRSTLRGLNATSGRFAGSRRLSNEPRPAGSGPIGESPARSPRTPRVTQPRRPPRSPRTHRIHTLCPVAVSTDEARSLARSLPEAVELDHHGRPSFRVDGKIFATLWNEHRMNLMLDEDGIRTAVESAPHACEEVWWGNRLAAVGVMLAQTDRDRLSDLLADAWEHRAPKRLLRDR